MSAFLSSLNLMELNEYTICLRIALSMLLGSILGAERTRKRRGAGLRTYTLVCLGATVVMMTGQFMMEYFGDTDPARLGAQVVSGIGFLGAGTILVTGAQKIKGLTTAAGLWAAACLGIAIGIGRKVERGVDGHIQKSLSISRAEYRACGPASGG